jgi:hypothetical protein
MWDISRTLELHCCPREAAHDPPLHSRGRAGNVNFQIRGHNPSVSVGIISRYKNVGGGILDAPGEVLYIGKKQIRIIIIIIIITTTIYTLLSVIGLLAVDSSHK